MGGKSLRRAWSAEEIEKELKKEKSKEEPKKEEIREVFG